MDALRQATVTIRKLPSPIPPIQRPHPDYSDRPPIGMPATPPGPKPAIYGDDVIWDPIQHQWVDPTGDQPGRRPPAAREDEVGGDALWRRAMAEGLSSVGVTEEHIAALSAFVRDHYDATSAPAYKVMTDHPDIMLYTTTDHHVLWNQALKAGDLDALEPRSRAALGQFMRQFQRLETSPVLYRHQAEYPLNEDGEPAGVGDLVRFRGFSSASRAPVIAEAFAAAARQLRDAAYEDVISAVPESAPGLDWGDFWIEPTIFEIHPTPDTKGIVLANSDRHHPEDETILQADLYARVRQVLNDTGANQGDPYLVLDVVDPGQLRKSVTIRKLPSPIPPIQRPHPDYSDRPPEGIPAPPPGPKPVVYGDNVVWDPIRHEWVDPTPDQGPGVPPRPDAEVEPVAGSRQILAEGMSSVGLTRENAEKQAQALDHYVPSEAPAFVDTNNHPVLRDYQSFDHVQINRFIRGLSSGEESSNIVDAARELISLMRRPLQTSPVLYRGTIQRQVFALDGSLAKVGDVITLDGLASTSRQFGFAANLWEFSDFEDDDYPVVLEIHATPRTLGVVLNSEEDETILAPDQRARVREVITDADVLDGQPYYVLDMLDEDAVEEVRAYPAGVEEGMGDTRPTTYADYLESLPTTFEGTEFEQQARDLGYEGGPRQLIMEGLRSDQITNNWFEFQEKVSNYYDVRFDVGPGHSAIVHGSEDLDEFQWWNMLVYTQQYEDFEEEMLPDLRQAMTEMEPMGVFPSIYRGTTDVGFGYNVLPKVGSELVLGGFTYGSYDASYPVGFVDPGGMLIKITIDPTTMGIADSDTAVLQMGQRAKVKSVTPMGDMYYVELDMLPNVPGQESSERRMFDEFLAESEVAAPYPVGVEEGESEALSWSVLSRDQDYAEYYTRPGVVDVRDQPAFVDAYEDSDTAAEDYQDGGYYHINKVLRGNYEDGPLSQYDFRRIGNFLAEMDYLGDVGAEARLFRGMNDELVEHLLEGDMVGKRISLSGFTSTSRDVRRAFDFIQNAAWPGVYTGTGEDIYLVEIIPNASTVAAVLESEYETVLAPNQVAVIRYEGPLVDVLDDEVQMYPVGVPNVRHLVLELVSDEI